MYGQCCNDLAELLEASNSTPGQCSISVIQKSMTVDRSTQGIPTIEITEPIIGRPYFFFTQQCPASGQKMLLQSLVGAKHEAYHLSYQMSRRHWTIISKVIILTFYFFRLSVGIAR